MSDSIIEKLEDELYKRLWNTYVYMAVDDNQAANNANYIAYGISCAIAMIKGEIEAVPYSIMMVTVHDDFNKLYKEDPDSAKVLL